MSNAITPGKVRWLGYWVLLALIILVFGWILPYSLPYEDAAILYRYAAHLSEGNGVVWNVGEMPVDGSTDFLFMLILGFLGDFGISPETGAKWVNAISLFGMAVIIWRRLNLRTSTLWAVFGTLWLLAGPVWLYVMAGFGTTLAAFLLLVAWNFFSMERGKDKLMGKGVGGAGIILLCGLARPEIGIMALLFGIFRTMRILPQSRKFVENEFLLTGSVLFVLGGLLLLVRYLYFGDVLPAPFYVKTASAQYGDRLWYFLNFLVLWVLFPLLGILIGLGTKSSRQKSIQIFIFLGIWAILWLFINQETNFYHRYQYALLPVMILVGIEQLSDWVGEIKGRKYMITGAFVALLGFQGTQTYLDLPYAITRADGRASIGLSLRDFNQKDYGLAATECGLLPYYSGWRTLDALGLNDYEIAKNGLKLEIIEAFDPAVIMYHSDPGKTTATAWQMLEDYAKLHDYIHAAAFCAYPDDCDHFWVKPGLQHSGMLVEKIGKRRYFRQWSQKSFENSVNLEKMDGK